MSNLSSYTLINILAGTVRKNVFIIPEWCGCACVHVLQCLNCAIPLYIETILMKPPSNYNVFPITTNLRSIKFVRVCVFPFLSSLNKLHCI